MNKSRIKEVIRKLLGEIDEEEICVSLLSSHYQNKSELAFFDEKSQVKIVEILKKLSNDSQRHERMLKDIINALTVKLDEG